MKVTGNKVSEEEGGIRKERGCVDQINIKLLYLGKGRKLYAASMNLKKSYERVDRRAIRDVLTEYSTGYWVGGQ